LILSADTRCSGKCEIEGVGGKWRVVSSGSWLWIYRFLLFTLYLLENVWVGEHIERSEH